MTKQVDINKVAQIAQARFPLEWEICVQQAYINNLENTVAEKDSEDVNELPDKS